MKRILYIQYTNPAGYPPLEHSSRLLAQKGWRVLFLGTRALGVDPLTFPPHSDITVRQMSFCAPGWQQKLHYLQFCLWVVIWTLRWQPQWIYASDLLACPVALILSFFPGLKVLYHEHDSPNLSPTSSLLKFCLTARQRLAHRADACILPNQQRADYFEKLLHLHQSPLCVWNCPAQTEVMPQRSAWNQQTLWVLYQGSIVPDRLPLSVLHALATLPDVVKLRVIGYETTGHAHYVKLLQETAKHLGLEQRIEFLGAMPRNKLLQYCQQSDIGLAFMPMTTPDINLSWMVGASNKPFDYLACGLPLVISSFPDWQEMYVNPGYGLDCNPDDPSSIAQTLRWYLEHPVEMREMGDQGRKRILKEWNYEAQFSPLLRKLLEGN